MSKSGSGVDACCGKTLANEDEDDTVINDLEVTGDAHVAGDMTVDGTLTAAGGISGVLTSLAVDNLFLDGNTISTTNTNGNLVLTPNGTGRTTTSKIVQADAGIAVPGLALGQSTNVIAASGGMAITTTGNNDINLLPNGTGTVVALKVNVDNVQVDGNTVSTTAGNLLLEPAAGSSVRAGSDIAVVDSQNANVAVSVENQSGGTAATAQWAGTNDAGDTVSLGLTGSGNTGVHGAKRGYLEMGSATEGLDIDVPATKKVRMRQGGTTKLEVGTSAGVPVLITGNTNGLAGAVVVNSNAGANSLASVALSNDAGDIGILGITGSNWSGGGLPARSLVLENEAVGTGTSVYVSVSDPLEKILNVIDGTTITTASVADGLVANPGVKAGATDTVNLSTGVIDTSDGDLTIQADGGSGTVTVNGLTGGSASFTQLDVDNVRIDGNDISSTSTNGDLNLLADGTGRVVAHNELRSETANAANQLIVSQNTNSGTTAAAGFLAVNDSNAVLISGITSSGNTNAFYGAGQGFVESSNGAAGLTVHAAGATELRLATNDTVRAVVGAAGANVSAPTNGGGSVEYAITNASNGNNLFNWGMDNALASEGGTLSLRRYNDANTVQGTPIQVVRSTGETTINDLNSSSVSITGGAISGVTVAATSVAAGATDTVNLSTGVIDTSDGDLTIQADGGSGTVTINNASITTSLTLENAQYLRAKELAGTPHDVLGTNASDVVQLLALKPGVPVAINPDQNSETLINFNNTSATKVYNGVTQVAQFDANGLNTVKAAVDNVQVDGNTISTTNTNGDLILTPNGTGKTSTTKLVQADGGIAVPGLAIGQATNTIAASGGIAITTTSNNDINLLPNGTGTVVATKMNVDNLQLDGNTVSTTNTNGNIVLSPNGTGIVETANEIRCQSSTNTANQVITVINSNGGTTAASCFLAHNSTGTAYFIAGVTGNGNTDALYGPSEGFVESSSAATGLTLHAAGGHDLRLATDGTVRATINANGLSTNGTDFFVYEEGTWTPAISQAGADYTAIPPTVSEAVYTRIGNMVDIQCQITINSRTGNVNNPFFIGGLPFPVAHDTVGSIFIANANTFFNGNTVLSYLDTYIPFVAASSGTDDLVVTTMLSHNGTNVLDLNIAQSPAFDANTILTINVRYRT